MPLRPKPRAGAWRGNFRFVLVTQDDLTRLQGRFLGVAPGNAAPFDGRVTDAVPEPECLSLRGQHEAVLSPDRLDPCHLVIRLASFQHGLEPLRIGAQSAASTTWTSGVPSGFSQCSGLLSPRSASIAHGLPSPAGTRAENWQANSPALQRFQAPEGDCDADPGLRRRAGWIGSRGHDLAHAPHQLPTRLAVVDARKMNVAAYGEGRGRRTPLDVFELEHDGKPPQTVARSRLWDFDPRRRIYCIWSSIDEKASLSFRAFLISSAADVGILAVLHEAVTLVLPAELDERSGVIPPVGRKPFEVLEHRRHAGLLEQVHGILDVLVEIRVEDPLVHEARVVVEEHPAQVVELECREEVGSFSSSFDSLTPYSRTASAFPGFTLAMRVKP